MLTSSEQPLTKAADTNADKVQTEVVAKCPESSKPPLNSSVNVERYTDLSKEMHWVIAVTANKFYINITEVVKSPCISTQTCHR